MLIFYFFNRILISIQKRLFICSIKRLTKRRQFEKIKEKLGKVYETEGFLGLSSHQRMNLIKKLGNRIKIEATFDMTNVACIKALIVSGEHNIGFKHLEKWIPLFEKHKSNCVFVTNSYGDFLHFRNSFLEYNFVFIAADSGIDEFLFSLTHLTHIYHVSLSPMSNLFLLSSSSVCHVHLGHGDSEKKVSANRFHKIYDEYWAFGQAQIDRFKNAQINMGGVELKIIGNPFAILSFSLPDSVCLMYAPTFEGESPYENICSLDIAEEIVAICLKYSDNLVIKLHPATGIRDMKYLTLERNLQTRFLGNDKILLSSKDQEALSFFSSTAALICDRSSVITDYLIYDRPIFLYEPTSKKNIKSSSKVPLSNFCYFFSSSEELENLIEEVVIQKNDYKKPDRIVACHYYMDMEKTVSQEFLRLLDQNFLVTPKSPIATNRQKKIAILLAGGSGKRMGIGVPKQFILLNEKPIIIYSLEKLNSCEQIDAIYIVCFKPYIETVKKYAEQFRLNKIAKVIEGGENREISLKKGIDAVEKDFGENTLVVIHDAARPDFSNDTLVSCINIAKEKGNAVSVYICTENMLKVNSFGQSNNIIFRDNCYRILTPQVYHLKELRDIFTFYGEYALSASVAIDTLYLKAGKRINVVPSEKPTIKITNLYDLDLINTVN